MVTPEQFGPVTDGMNETTAVAHPTPPLPSARMSVLEVHRLAVREKRRQRRDRQAAAAAATPGPVADVSLAAQHASAADVDDAAADDQPPMPEKNAPSPALKAFEAARMAFRATRRGAAAVSQDEDHRGGQWGKI